MEMILFSLVILISGSFGAPVTSHNISLHCEEDIMFFLGVSPEEVAPSPLSALNISLSLEDGRHMLDVSWAVNMDSTAKYIESTEINTGQETFKCEYDPSIKDAISRGLIPKDQEKVWFHHRIHVFAADLYHVQAANLPLPPPENGPAYVDALVYAPRKTAPTVKIKAEVITTPASVTPARDKHGRRVLVLLVGCLILALLLLFIASVSYKVFKSSASGGFQKVGSPAPRVPVLLVYPADGAVFQGAVVALAEFLQQDGGCSVEVDLWQQSRVAKLGPMRWLHEQIQEVHKVLIVAPKPCSPPLSSIKPLFPEVTAPPAAAQDLYPLVLNLVAARAKNFPDLAKFWVVRFGETGDLTPELQTCRSFCLMKDLNKLCRGLQSGRADRNTKITDLLMPRADFCGGKSAEKLRAAVKMLH